MTHLYKLFIIGLGGFIGAIGRYTISGWIQRIFKSTWYPIGTLGVNCLGCLLIGPGFFSWSDFWEPSPPSQLLDMRLIRLFGAGSSLWQGVI